MIKQNRRLCPVISLLLLAPLTGELLSGSSPPAEYFQPFTFILLTALYGCGALLVREIARRWRLDLRGIFLLGMAYGIYEEGVLVQSFFNPAWMDLGILGEYGRWLGVNWIWSIALTLFHASISISVPILLVELIFPAHKDALWLGKRGMVICAIILLDLLPLMPFLVAYHSLGGIMASLASMAILAFFAKKDARKRDMNGSGKPVKPRVVMVVFLFFMIALILGMYAFPALGLPVWSDFLFLSALPWLALLCSLRLGVFGWDERHCWSAVFGLLLPWLLLSFAAEAENAARPDDTSGMSLVGLISILLLIVLRVLIYLRKNRTDNKNL